MFFEKEVVMKFNFPEIIPKIPSVAEQYEVIREELEEFASASTRIKQEEEAVDVLQAVETFIRLIFKNRKNELSKMIVRVIRKNKKRGYYK